MTLSGFGATLLDEVLAVDVLPSSNSPRIFFSRLSSFILDASFSLASFVLKKFFNDFFLAAGSSGSFPFFFVMLLRLFEFV
jgi:phosphatidate phosphatase APP1